MDVVLLDSRIRIRSVLELVNKSLSHRRTGNKIAEKQGQGRL